MGDKIERIKTHIEKHKVAYACAATTVIVAGITAIIMRSNSKLSIQGGTTVLAKGGTTVFGKSTILTTASFIPANRQGSPSWVIRCLETGNVFTSQRAAALAMDLNESRLSTHLNGMTDHVSGYHFERICMAA